MAKSTLFLGNTVYPSGLVWGLRTVEDRLVVGKADRASVAEIRDLMRFQRIAAPKLNQIIAVDDRSLQERATLEADSWTEIHNLKNQFRELVAARFTRLAQQIHRVVCGERINLDFQELEDSTTHDDSPAFVRSRYVSIDRTIIRQHTHSAHIMVENAQTWTLSLATQNQGAQFSADMCDSDIFTAHSQAQQLLGNAAKQLQNCGFRGPATIDFDASDEKVTIHGVRPYWTVGHTVHGALLRKAATPEAVHDMDWHTREIAGRRPSHDQIRGLNKEGYWYLGPLHKAYATLKIKL